MCGMSLFLCFAKWHTKNNADCTRTGDIRKQLEYLRRARVQNGVAQQRRPSVIIVHRKVMEGLRRRLSQRASQQKRPLAWPASWARTARRYPVVCVFVVAAETAWFGLVRRGTSAAWARRSSCYVIALLSHTACFMALGDHQWAKQLRAEK